MAGYLLRCPVQARRFVLEELGGMPGDGDAHAYGLAWAGRALLEIPPGRVAWHDSARDELARRLVQVLWQNPPRPRWRRGGGGACAGPAGRPPLQRPLPAARVHPYSGGNFWMGSDEAEVGALAQAQVRIGFKDEAPRHQVELAPFALAPYPTTNAMFRRFWEAWATQMNAGGPRLRLRESGSQRGSSRTRW